jgi:hypothetical protein
MARPLCAQGCPSRPPSRPAAGARLHGHCVGVSPRTSARHMSAVRHRAQTTTQDSFHQGASPTPHTRRCATWPSTQCSRCTPDSTLMMSPCRNVRALAEPYVALPEHYGAPTRACEHRLLSLLDLHVVPGHMRRSRCRPADRHSGALQLLRERARHDNHRWLVGERDRKKHHCKQHHLPALWYVGFATLGPLEDSACARLTA